MVVSVPTNDRKKVQPRRLGRVGGVVASWRTCNEYTWRFWGGRSWRENANEVLTRFGGFIFEGDFSTTRTVDQSISPSQPASNTNYSTECHVSSVCSL